MTLVTHGVTSLRYSNQIKSTARKGTILNRSQQGRHAANHRHFRDRLVAAYEAADAEAVEAGRLWYPTGEAVVAKLAADYIVGIPAAAGIVAALSPQVKWRQNIESARSILAGHGRVMGYDSNTAKARRIAAGEPADKVLGGPKVRNFWANLRGSREAVTIDVWAQRAAAGRDLAPPKGPQYLRIVKAYRAAAAQCGEVPRDFQAIIWLCTRPRAEHLRDVAAIGAA